MAPSGAEKRGWRRLINDRRGSRNSPYNTRCSIQRIPENAMSEWSPAVVLPNMQANVAIESSSFALVQYDDPRVQTLCENHRSLRQFLSAFSNAFGRKVEPGLIIVRNASSERAQSFEALAGFRDAIAASVVPLGRALRIQYPHQQRSIFSNTFDFYPWMMAKDYSCLVCNTAAQSGMHDIGKFHGQSNPEVGLTLLADDDIDRPLLSALLRRWEAFFGEAQESWENRALFRSLNMAHDAARTPTNTLSMVYDWGRLIALAVSSCEILVHHGHRTAKHLNRAVYRHFDRVDWKRELCRARKYRVANQDRILACWIYNELDDRRNDFIHGNPIDDSALRLHGSDHILPFYAPLLYRMLLTGFLNLNWPSTDVSLLTLEQTSELLSQMMDFENPQRDIESAICNLAH